MAVGLVQMGTVDITEIGCIIGVVVRGHSGRFVMDFRIIFKTSFSWIN